jgi:hypothetical protein
MLWADYQSRYSDSAANMLNRLKFDGRLEEITIAHLKGVAE